MEKRIDCTEVSDERLQSRVISFTGADVERLTKEASSEVSPEIAQCIARVRATPGKTYILVNALGAGEYYGSNINGDFFREAELDPPDGTSAYGYKTFLTAGVYRNHENKDRAKSYGKVICAAFNKVMRRVELVIEIDRAKAEQLGHSDLLRRIDAGERVAVSMGCHVDFDVCSICGYKSKSLKDRCPHAEKEMGHVYPDGRRVHVDNPKPRFFDLSIVIIGADRASFVMAKLASVRHAPPTRIPVIPANDRALLLSKLAASALKTAQINKVLPATDAEVVRRVADSDDDIPSGRLDELARGCRGDVGGLLAGLGAGGIVLRPHEFQRITLIIMGRNDLADAYDARGFDLPEPCQCDRSVSLPTSMGAMHRILPMLQSITGLMPGRSAFTPQLGSRVFMSKTARAACKPAIRRKAKTALLQKLADAYAGYRAELEEKLPEIVAGITCHRLDLLSASGAVSAAHLVNGEKLAAWNPQIQATPALLVSPLTDYYVRSAYGRKGR